MPSTDLLVAPFCVHARTHTPTINRIKQGQASIVGKSSTSSADGQTKERRAPATQGKYELVPYRGVRIKKKEKTAAKGHTQTHALGRHKNTEGRKRRKQ